jgi:hypothetical protein
VAVAEAVEAEERLSEALEKYAGQWVAIRQHVVVEAADSLEALLEKLNDATVDRVFEVPSDDAAACFF